MTGRRPPEPEHDYGAIVCWRDGGGRAYVVHEPGRPLAAVAALVNRIPRGATVRAISTPASILHDLTKPPRIYGGSKRYRTVDPYSLERQYLGKVGRLDLLPDEAYLWGRRVR